MKFRTEVQIPVSETALEIDDRVFSIGSCFSSEMSNLLKTGQIQTLNNPFGTTFNPYSINQAVNKLHDSQFYTEDDLMAEMVLKFHFLTQEQKNKVITFVDAIEN